MGLGLLKFRSLEEEAYRTKTTTSEEGVLASRYLCFWKGAVRLAAHLGEKLQVGKIAAAAEMNCHHQDKHLTLSPHAFIHSQNPVSFSLSSSAVYFVHLEWRAGVSSSVLSLVKSLFFSSSLLSSPQPKVLSSLPWSQLLTCLPVFIVAGLPPHLHLTANVFWTPI